MIWFKHCRVFECLEPVTASASALSDVLEPFAFTPCEAFEVKRFGWTSPATGASHAFVHEQQGRLLLRLTLEHKILPAVVINETLAETVERLEEKEGRRLSKRERTQLKTEVIDELLPRAFSRHQHIEGYIDQHLGLLCVNTSSSTLAETFTIALRQALGSLKIRLPDSTQWTVLMTDALTQRTVPEGFCIDDMCMIKDGLDTRGSIRCQNQNLFAEDIQSLLGPGREVVALRMIWKDQIRFVLKEEGSIHNIQFLDTVLKQASNEFVSSEVEQFVTDFSLMSESLSQLVAALISMTEKKLAKKKENHMLSAGVSA